MTLSRLFKSRWFWLAVVCGLVSLAGYGWVERKPLQAWYYARQLGRAPLDQRDDVLTRLAELDAHAVDALLSQLRSADPDTCANCGWGLTELGRRLRADEAISLLVVERTGAAYSRLSDEGKQQALVAVQALAARKDHAPSDAWVASVWALLQVVEKDASKPRRAALQLATLLAGRAVSEDQRQLCRQLAEVGLDDERPEVRGDAVRLAASPGTKLLDRLVGVVLREKKDPSAEVRALALAAVAAHEEILSTDDLLPLLHDPSGEVRSICEQALRGRGLSGPHLQLARQMTDPEPAVRARVPAQVQGFPDLDSQLWLERLSRDPSPAVRAAVIRAAVEGQEVNLVGRLQEIASKDPSPTVRQIAHFYLQSR